MHRLFQRPAVVAAAITITAGALAGVLALRPAFAAGDGSMTIHVGPFTLVTCNQASPNACQQYKNTGTGTGVEGDAAKGTGVKGTSNTAAAISVQGVANKGTGVEGTSNTGRGVVGLSSASKGVEGSSSDNGVFGSSQSGIGVQGQGGSGIGVLSDSYGSTSIFADNLANGNAVEAHGAGTGASYYAYPFGGGPAGYFDATANTGYGTITYSAGSPAQWAYNSNGNGNDTYGSYVGVIARSNTFPFVATDSGGNDLFFIDGAGNVYYHGGLFQFAKTRGGGSAITYGNSSTSPTIDDNGTAQLVNGMAMVRLDSTFATAIDSSRPYQVMLTPDGDTRGLFVASKTAQGFVVREVQGGRSSISFDYHIYAPTLGHANDRMAPVNRYTTTSPRAATVRPPALKPTRSPIRHK
jgi:hypothetical protein